MKRNFKLFATWVVITGLLMGVAFGVGTARGKSTPAENGTGLTQQQVQQLLNGTGGGGTTPQLPAGGGPGGGGPGG